jgi:hypothetical protein
MQHNSWVVAIDNSTVGALTVECIHYLGFFIAVGAIVLVDLRVLGLAGRRQTLTEFGNQLFSLMWIGLGLVVFSGFMMFAASAEQFARNPVFHFKLYIILFALVFNIIVQRGLRKWDRLPTIPAASKIVAIISLLLWIGTIIAAVEVPALTGVG